MGWLNMTWTWAATQVITAARLNVIKAQIEAVVNGALDLTNLSPALRIYQSKTLYLLPPGMDAVGTLSYLTVDVDGYARDVCSFVASTNMTITGVSCRAFRTGAELATCQLYVAGAAVPATILQATTMDLDPAVINGLTIGVLAGQKVSVRVNSVGFGVLQAYHLPIEYTIHYKNGIAAG